DRAEIAELHHVGAAGAHRGDLLDGDHRVHQRAALAPVGLGKADAHQPLRAHELRDIDRIARIVRPLKGSLLQGCERETANRVGKGLLLFGEVELHPGSFLSPSTSPAEASIHYPCSGNQGGRSGSSPRPVITGSSVFADEDNWLTADRLYRLAVCPRVLLYLCKVEADGLGVRRATLKRGQRQ